MGWRVGFIVTRKAASEGGRGCAWKDSHSGAIMVTMGKVPSLQLDGNRH